MEAILDALSNSQVAKPLILTLTVYVLWIVLFASSSLPNDLPWIGRDNSKAFSSLRATIKSISRSRELLAEGYQKYSSKGKSYIFPACDGPSEILVPKSSLRWLLEQPDNVLSAAEYHSESLGGDYNFLDKYILEDPFQDHVIYRSLTRNLQSVIPEVWDELASTFEDTWGTDRKAWKAIPLMDSMMTFVGRASNRMLVGAPVCQNKEYLANMMKYTTDVVVNGAILRVLPKFLHPVIGRLLSLRNQWHYSRTAKYTIPIIEERLRHMERKRNDPTYDWEQPSDYITWHINLAIAENNSIEMDPIMISRRLMPINFAAIHTTTITITNAVIDILSTSASKGVLEGLQEEIEHAYAACNGVWTKASLATLVRTDSAIRESMRVSNFMTRNAMRKVMPAGGVTNPTEKWTAPQGAYIGIDMHSIHHDPEIYPSPNEYDAFRFSRAREEASASSGDALDKMKKTESMSTTSGDFLSFSHGRHACPGRFFVVYELKMLLAFMLLNYEVEPLSQRPQNKWIGGNVVPPSELSIRVKRKA
ncbi:putative P450 monooxygenase [Aspergillus campestris IBT 28561]|uniref:P450 monooxygenase n=1 Tax=Aspergillus campestris (strain IBT 28561) TaxID=1392248 RepID=A0A2I1D4X9_ASPC2|nr:putative P450 monooxygenase [Aspergillus campestris IBT 28561]PKY04920.1 putative P450 monooxygenase [Aspergillus campestris IBT 28561]